MVDDTVKEMRKKRTLKQCRKLAALSVNEVAEHLNIGPRSIYAWEDGTRPITAANLFRLMRLYNADAHISDIPNLIPLHLDELPERGE